MLQKRNNSLIIDMSEDKASMDKEQLISMLHFLEKRDEEQNKTKRQKAMVKESLTRAFDELHSDKAHHNAHNLFD